ncbi:MAG: polysaccharide biosynthesis protein [Flavobacteriaceae bacterium]|jgi:UDP-N-acetylglucosamine 4,6-dehydratase/5-epimerase|nr:polysaccharide biosynthesis protein [Flavobacteriaceae bacterium]
MSKGKLLITGGTGSFGNAYLKQALNKQSFSEIIIFSRDELKQNDLRQTINSDKVKFHLGDIRDYEAVNNVVQKVDFIFHAAALKQVPSCEFFPVEAVKTNVIGTNNILTAADNHKIKKVITLSTDKAAYPINAMGMTKALMEKVMVAKSRTMNSQETILCGTRFGNVMGSRGSVIPLFINQIKNNKDLTITHPKMTRFLMSLSNAVKLVDFAFENGEQGDILVQKAPAASIETLAQALINIFNSSSKIKVIGIRHGEKMHETLLTEEEMFKADDLGDYYRIKSDSRGLNYDKYFSEGDVDNNMFNNMNSNKAENSDKYNSNSTKILPVGEVEKILKQIPEVKSLM